MIPREIPDVFIIAVEISREVGYLTRNDKLHFVNPKRLSNNPSNNITHNL